MYKKLLKSNIQIELNQHDLKWLLAKRISFELNSDNLRISNDKINFDEISDVKILVYNSFLFFKINSILSFKYLSNYYQIGINNREKEMFKKFYRNEIDTVNKKLVFRDFIYFFLILFLFLLLFYQI